MAIPKQNRNSYLKISLFTVFLLCLLGGIVFLASDNFTIGILMLVIPFPIVFVAYIFAKPVVGYIAVLYANYFAIGLTRYLPGPLGLSVDSLLVLTWIAIFFSQFQQKIEWKKAWTPYTLVALIWFSYTLFQFFNPEAVSRVAWFYAMRGVSLYMLLTIPMVSLVFYKSEQLELFIKIWAWFTLAGVFKGMMQKFLGVDPWEDHWLDMGGGITHRLPGGLRIFSFFSDSATYGGSMGFSGVVFTIIALSTDAFKKKVFYLVVAGMAFFALLISGTRGAMAVPFAGFALYTLLSKRFKMVIMGGLLLMGMYGFLKFTTIGNSVYEIRRFRNALDPNNPSLMVRKENQKKFRVYLASRPFGGGIGSAGNWGLRFSPGTFLAETPPDGWYVQIWAEQGIVGLLLHISILLFILFKNSQIIMFKLKSKEYQGKAAAFTSGLFGVMIASYSSGALGQMPNGIIIYSSLAFVLLMPEWEKERGI